MLITPAVLIIHFNRDENAKGWGKEEREEETVIFIASHRLFLFPMSLLFSSSDASPIHTRKRKRREKPGHLDCIAPWLHSVSKSVFTDRGESGGSRRNEGSHGRLS